jgi:hypothetical protein
MIKRPRRITRVAGNLSDPLRFRYCRITLPLPGRVNRSSNTSQKAVSRERAGNYAESLSSPSLLRSAGLIGARCRACRGSPGSEVFRLQAGPFSRSRKHSSAYLVAVVKCKLVVGPAPARKQAMGPSLAIYPPPASRNHQTPTSLFR